LATTVTAQKIKTKDIKRAIENKEVSAIKLISGDTFIPEIPQDFDLQITLQNGTTLLASEHHVIWSHVDITATNATAKIKSEFLANGKGRLHPLNLSEYYTAGKISLEVAMLGMRDAHELVASYCINGYHFERQGQKGSSGSSGSSGYSGSAGSSGRDGYAGANGPDMEIQVDEEVIADKTMMVITFEGKKYPFDPACSSVMVASIGGHGGDGGNGGNGGEGSKRENQYTGSGGRGGNGGNGGRGGSGGTIYVSGSAVDKYKDKFKFISQGGNGGRSGNSGRGGNGRSSGSSGSMGSSGSKGMDGQVVMGSKGKP
jgi:hypothetical protein